MDHEARAASLRHAVALIVDRCPRIVAGCYWAGTSVVALEDLDHRESFDLDLHTQEALDDVRPYLAELERAFPRAVEVVAPPDAHGSGFTAALRLDDGARLPVQVFAGFEHVPDGDLAPSKTAPRLRRVTLRRYLEDKVQCVAERLEARDLVDIASVVALRPHLQPALVRAVAAQDALLLAERLLSWSDDALREDLRPNLDVDPAEAIQMRDVLLRMLRAEAP